MRLDFPIKQSIEDLLTNTEGGVGSLFCYLFFREAQLPELPSKLTTEEGHYLLLTLIQREGRVKKPAAKDGEEDRNPLLVTAELIDYALDKTFLSQFCPTNTTAMEMMLKFC